ncbi:thyrotropin-releasing hormone receptor-like isoform X2 [Paramacrobiotus metropolitanus]|uniref:thyrotropin-releasing hormone receptor-like isoform X2 n=1 Tax=Paramacrobiotus metropolitanus TaxID=2943436 RepID=UPI0024460386|nr:thyrotropin-releasing hormone receptor-like isoform X2 [Paramacrobiotus metropolitanus]
MTLIDDVPVVDINKAALSSLEQSLYDNSSLFRACLHCELENNSASGLLSPTPHQLRACLLWLTNVNYSAQYFMDPCNIRRVTFYPLDYRIVATILHTIIFIVGFFGNILICFVVHSTKKLHTTTYCYLVSLAMADLLLVSSAIPQEILAHQLYGKQWILGQAGCSILVFMSFLSINAGALSILAFTVERYIAICHPVKAHIICTMSRARKIIIAIWVTLILYCCPWLGLALIKPLPRLDAPGLVYCDYRLPRNDYLYFYLADATIFYLVPLILSLILYTKIISVLWEHVNSFRRDSDSNYTATRRRSSAVGGDKLMLDVAAKARFSIVSGHPQADAVEHSGRARWQVVRMLIVVVVLFAVLWLPYRGLLVYNSLVATPFQKRWFMLLAKTLVFCNSAINPFLYTICCPKFRNAFLGILSGRQKEPAHGFTSRRKSFSPL